MAAAQDDRMGVERPGPACRHQKGLRACLQPRIAFDLLPSIYHDKLVAPAKKFHPQPARCRGGGCIDNNLAAGPGRANHVHAMF